MAANCPTSPLPLVSIKLDGITSVPTDPVVWAKLRKSVCQLSTQKKTLIDIENVYLFCLASIPEIDSSTGLFANIHPQRGPRKCLSFALANCSHLEPLLEGEGWVGVRHKKFLSKSGSKVTDRQAAVRQCLWGSFQRSLNPIFTERKEASQTDIVKTPLVLSLLPLC